MSTFKPPSTVDVKAGIPLSIMPYMLPRWALIVCNVLLPVAILVFASGFFPYKPFIAGRSEFSASERVQAPKAVFDRVIFMVVDALRSDFVYAQGSGFTFVQQLIRDGNAVPFTAHASSPTITMPKVKAITTGSVPSFLDVILNFAESDTTSNLAHMDTWLNQLRHLPGGKLVMYGDDTWLKLFPGFFERHDDVITEIFKDFTEVDNNVTRHVSDELQREDWNGWFLHYLGLDHIGHKSGPESPHMIPKQREMDGIVERIYGGMVTNPHLASSLFIICGDHGMNEAGNHGGAAPGETSPALVFMSPKFQALNISLASPTSPENDFEYYEVVEQSDIAPTIAGLLGFPVPLNNLGVFIRSFLQLWKEESQQVHLVAQNVRQIHKIIEETIGNSSFEPTRLRQANCEERATDLVRLQCGWLAQADGGLATPEARRLEYLYEYLRTAQRMLSSTASNYNTVHLSIGIALTTITLAATTVALVSGFMTAEDRKGLGLLILLAGPYSIMMFASSFVEEEHHFWYWSAYLASFWWFLLIPSRKVLSRQRLGSFFVVLLLLRIIRRWNQTGQKHAGNPDIGRTFLRSHTAELWALTLGTYAFFGARLIYRQALMRSRVMSWIFAICLGFCAVTFKISFTRADAPELLAGVENFLELFAVPLNLVDQARVVFALIGLGLSCVLTVTRVWGSSSQDHQQTLAILRDILSFFLATQTRVNNIPLLVIFEAIFWHIREATLNNHRRYSPVELAMCALVFQQTCFFAFGGTNAISSVDLSNAYNGVSGYNVVAVGILTFVSNWIGPIWWALAMAEILVSWHDASRSFIKYALAMTCFVSCSLAATMVACTVLRTHLFIWTVFSPKFLYSMAWSLGQHLAINLCLTRFLLWVE